MNTRYYGCDEPQRSRHDGDDPIFKENKKFGRTKVRFFNAFLEAIGRLEIIT